MLTPTGKPIVFGSLRGVKYVFAPGDGLPRHVHGEDDAHVTNVMQGNVIVRSGVHELVVEAGGIVNFPAGMEHEIEAGPGGAIIVNYLTGVTAP